MAKIIIELVEFVFHRFVDLMYKTDVKINMKAESIG